MSNPQTLSGPVTLEATNHIGSKRRYDLPPDQGVFIGSSSNCGLQLQGGGLAGIQCHVAMEEGKLWIQEWMSAEGTLLNGQAITAKQQLQLGDLIEIGQHKIEVLDSRSLPSVAASDAQPAAQTTDTQPATPVADTQQRSETKPTSEPDSVDANQDSDEESIPEDLTKQLSELCRINSEAEAETDGG